MPLTFEEWEKAKSLQRALAMTGASRETLDEFDRIGEPVSKPRMDLPTGTDRALELTKSRVNMPPDIDRALELTGSSYRPTTRMEIGPIEIKRQTPEPAVSRGALPENPYEDDVHSAQPSGGAQSGNELPPKAAAALAAYRAQYPMNATGRDTGLGRPKQISDPNEETATIQAQALMRGGSDLGLTSPDQRLPLAGKPSMVTELPAQTERTASRSLPENPYKEPISQRDFNPNVGSRKLQNEYTQGVNEVRELLGDKGSIAAGAQDRIAVEAGKLKQIREDGLQLLRERIGRNEQDIAAYEAKAKAHLANVSGMITNPPEFARGGALRAIGAILGGMPGAGGIGAGLSMMGRDMAGNVDKWHGKIQSQGEAYRMQMQAIEGERGDSEHQIRMEKGLTDLGFGVYEAAIEQIKAEAGSQEARRAATELQSEWRNKYVASQIALNEKAHAAGLSAEQKAEDIRTTGILGNTPEPERPRLAAKMGPRAVELLGEMQKTDLGVAELGSKMAGLEKTRAETEKIRTEQKEGPKLTDGDKKLRRLALGVRPAYDALSKVAADVASGKSSVPYVGIGPGATEMFAGEDTQGLNKNILQLANVLLRDESGASLPPSEQETKWEGWGLTSPDAAVRNRGLGKMLAEYEGRVVDVAPVTARPGESGGGDVMMRSPSGRVVPIPAESLQKARDAGYKPVDHHNLTSRR